MSTMIRQTLKDVRKIYLVSVILFLVIIVLSSWIFGHYRGKILYNAAIEFSEGEEIPFDEKTFEEKLKQAEKKHLDKKDYEIIGWEDVKELFLNNSWIGIKSLSIGIIPFLFLPVFVLGLNALAVSISYIMLTSISNATLSVYLAMILPHGIIEYAAVLLAFSLGLLLCLDGSKRILRKKVISFSERAKGVLLVYLFVVVPLLAVSAVIEAYLTPLLIQALL